jgi:L-ascorbate metabolism protein UlaG (beta-lactamase superfamily)
MKLIAEKPIEVACLPIGGNYTMDADESITAIQWLKPKVAFPTHYNTFPVIVQDVATWAQRVTNETTSQPVVVDPGSSFSV